MCPLIELWSHCRQERQNIASWLKLGVSASESKHLELPVEFDNPIDDMDSHASTVVGLNHGIGSGKVQHIEATQLGLQEKVSEDDCGDNITLKKCVGVPEGPQGVPWGSLGVPQGTPRAAQGGP